MQHLILIACLVHAALSAPQDGKVGVNFLGYHAEAGLGGGQQDGQGLLGGLHASAGTPWGQNAAAGLGGNVNGRSSGFLYAGAEATPDVGASTVLGGDTSAGGFRGAEAHANGRVQSKMHNLLMNPQPPLPPLTVTDNDGSAIQKIPHTTNNNNDNNNNNNKNEPHNFDGTKEKLYNNTPSPAADDSFSIVKQRSKYRQRQHHQHPKRRHQREKIRSKTIYKAVEKPQKTMLAITSASVSSEIHPQLIQYTQIQQQQQQQQQKQQQEKQKKLIIQKHSSRRALVADHATSDTVNVNVVKAKPTGKNVQVAYDSYPTGDVVRQSLQIPIGILQSLQESLTGLRGRKIVTVHHEVTKP